MAVRHLLKRLVERPVEVSGPGVVLRNYGGERDIEPWLGLRRVAFARERLGVRDWIRADFEAEFLSRWWWKPERMWLAETVTASSGSKFPLPIVGTVTLAFRGEQSPSVPVVHWLAVHPKWRGQGIGRLLMAQLEATAWDLGERQISLETYDAWTGAAAFYHKLGYLPAANLRTASG